MSAPPGKRFAYNRTKSTYLATQLSVADTHWSRLRGLMGMHASDFPTGSGLWIVPCHGVHSLGMRFPIDVLYLDADNMVVHAQEKLSPWRIAPVMVRARTVVELPPGTIRNTSTAVGDTVEFGSNGAGIAG